MNTFNSQKCRNKRQMDRYLHWNNDNIDVWNIVKLNFNWTHDERERTYFSGAINVVDAEDGTETVE